MNKSKIITWWKSSTVFKFIDKKINKFFIKKLKNDNFTILCSNCVGGTIYHRLEKQFLSPTVNMYFTQPDFVKFLLNLDYYLNDDLCFIHTNETTPVATLGGKDEIPFITLHFNHAGSRQEAKDNWERRKQRINKDNLYIMLYNLDGITEEEIHLLDNYKCNNKVLLSQTPVPGVDWAYQIIPNQHSKYASVYLGKDIFGVRWIEKKFDFVGFLNKK